MDLLPPNDRLLTPDELRELSDGKIMFYVSDAHSSTWSSPSDRNSLAHLNEFLCYAEADRRGLAVPGFDIFSTATVACSSPGLDFDDEARATEALRLAGYDYEVRTEARAGGYCRSLSVRLPDRSEFIAK